MITTCDCLYMWIELMTNQRWSVFPSKVRLSIFSAHGMRFKTKAELSPGTRLNITVGIGKPFCMYLLRGDLRWSRRTEDGQYSMGVLLIPAEGTDFDTWLEAFDQLFDDTPD